MLSLQFWYPDHNLRDLCERVRLIAPGLGLELAGDPADKVDMGMVGSWELARLAARPVFLGLTEGDHHYGVVTIFHDAETPELTGEFERLLAAVWKGAGPPYPTEASIVKGMDDVQGPMLCLFPITSRLMVLILRQVGEPGDETFAPQIRVGGPALVKKTGLGVIAAMARKHATAVLERDGTVWLDFGWSHFRPGWQIGG
ncbi:MAG: hypothetical protein HY816_21785 [Candidatus Wallbacteria bacterium]|nr:hypothetical protein [Candidatus Wallbacteria bacterium]